MKQEQRGNPDLKKKIYIGLLFGFSSFHFNNTK